MPAYYFTICQDDGEIYLYDKSASATATTGKFKKFTGGSGSSDVKFFDTTDTLSDEINGTKNVVAGDLPGVDWADLVVGSSVIKDAKGTLGLITAINGSANVTVTTATTSTPTKELTQAEYDALTEAEKKNGTIYFITDNYVGSTYVGAYDTIYSTTEKVIGSWMGKPLYQKTVNLQLPEISTDGQTETITIPFTDSRINIDNPETGWISSGFGYTNDGTMLPIMNINSAWGNNYQTAQYFVYAAFHMVQLGIMLQANRSTNSKAPITLTLQYTKTTDSTSPVEYASPNDYSTSEKIVGTYNGKPLYQKSWFDLEDDYVLPTNDWVDIPTVSLSGVDKLVDCVVMSNQSINTPSADYIFGFAYGWDRTAGHLLLQNIRSTSNSIGVDGRKYDITIKYTKVSS